MKTIIVVTILSVVAFSSSAWAATEQGFRFNVGMVPGINELEVDGYGTTDLDDEACVNFNPVFVLRTNTDKTLGFVGALGLFVRNHIGDMTGSDKAELTAYGISVSPGLAVNLSEKVHLEFKAEIGLGGAEQSISGFSDGSGPYASLGVTAGSYVNVTDVIVLGVDLGYMGFASDGEIEIAGNTYDTTFSGDGVSLNASIGFMF